MKKLYSFIKIIFFSVVIFGAIYLKQKDFLSSIQLIDLIDKTDFIIEYNQFSTILICLSILLLCLFIVYYQLSLSLNRITKLDKMMLSYYIINLIVLVLARVGSTGNGNLAQLSVMLSSITFLQSFLGIIPIGIVVYIPIIYLFFIQKSERKELLKDRMNNCG